MTTPAASPVRWPDEHRPEGAPVFAHNEIEVNAPPKHVWAWLVRAPMWPTFYRNAGNIVFENATGPDLAPGVRFSWNTFRVRVTTTIVEFEPFERLAWSGVSVGGVGYHAWVVTPTPRGCRVVTEETQRGVVPSLGRFFLRRGLTAQHQRWLEGLKRVAEGGLPGSSRI